MILVAEVPISPGVAFWDDNFDFPATGAWSSATQR